VFSITAIGLALTLGFYVGEYVRSPHVGYFAWLASMVVVLVGECPAGAASGSSASSCGVRAGIRIGRSAGLSSRRR